MCRCTHVNILESIASNVEAYPERTAYVLNAPDRTESITWSELGAHSDRMGSYIVQNIPGKKPVVIYGHKDPLMIASFVACSKSGRAYCPVDVSVPEGRLQDIVGEVEPDLVIAFDELPRIDCGNALVLTADDVARIATGGDTIDLRPHWIGADNVYIGKVCGEYVADVLLPDGGKICEIEGLAGTSGGIERDQGFREGIAKNPKLEIIAHNNADWLREKAITVAEEMLQTNDEIDLFFALNDPMAEGAYIAATNAGREKDMKFIGVDGLPTPDGGIRSVMDGRLSLTMVYPTGGAEAIQSAYKLLVEGEELEKNVTLGTEVVTPENAEEVLAKYGG